MLLSNIKERVRLNAMKIYLCGEKGCCPSVNIGTNHVEIGEEGNKCTLTMDEWTELKTQIKENKI